MIAVGSVDQNNNFSTFSNPAGDTDTAYLVAPGTNIVTTALGGGTTTVSGTSFSAPHVSGAIALILQRFPTLSSQQAVDLLLTTATDLGAAGTDTTFGRGLLNLAAAFQAQGLSVLPMGDFVKGPSEEILKTIIELGPAFGNALSDESFLALAMVLDSYERPFRVDFAKPSRHPPH